MLLTFEANPLPMWVFDVDTLRILAVNGAAVARYGYTREEFTAMTIGDLRPPDDMPALERQVAAECGDLRRAGIWRHVRADGTILFASVTSRDLAWGGRRARLVVAVDVTDSVDAQQALRETERLFRSIVETAREGIVMVEPDTTISYANDRMGELVGCKARDLVGRSVAELVGANRSLVRDGLAAVAHERPLEPREVRLHRDDGTQLWVLVSASPLLGEGGQLRAVIAMATDITARKQLEEQVQRQSLHDQLTGLPNRALLVDRIAQHRLRGEAMALVAVDLDGFAQVNQVIGHAAGDELLTAVGERLRGLAAGWTVARLGSDRFVVLLSGVGGEARALAWARACRDAIGEPFSIAGDPVHVRARTGVVVDQGHALADELVQFADAAIDHAKQMRTHEPVPFREELCASARQRFSMEGELRDAIERRELVVHYQPIIRIADGVPVGAEALVRWQHPTRGLLGPGAFLPHVEDSDLICLIGEYVLREACAQAAAWQRDVPESPYKVSVNVAPRQVTSPDFAKTVHGILSDAGVAPASIQLEVTEASVMADVGAASYTLRGLKALGVGLALDDFGTGYSSLAYLKRFPFDVVKIDKSFVDGLGRDAEDGAIVGAVVDLAAALGMTVVAEGVETTVQRAELAARGCEFAQGFLWRPAVPAAEIDELRRMWAAPSGRTPSPAMPAHRRPPAARGHDDAVVAAVAHELRQPLAVMSGYAELLADQPPDRHATGEYAAAIRRSAQRMRRIVESLTDAHDADRGMLSLVPVQTSLVELVTSAAANATKVIGPARDVRVCAGHDVETVVDPDRLLQVIDNLLVNADRYSPAGSPIEIRLEQADGHAEIVVRDHGPGIPDDDAGYVFRKFARLDNAKKGSGLGLYIGRAIARAHHGDLRYRHARGGGAEFVLSLPVTSASLDAAS